MLTNRFTATVIGLGLFASATYAVILPSQGVAAAKDYRFELAGAPVKSGNTTLIKVRLLHLPDAKPVLGAIIIQTKLDMGPDGMASMTAPAKAAGAAEAGIYQIEAEPEMAGNWALHLSAKVQGERETVNGTVAVAIAK